MSPPIPRPTKKEPETLLEHEIEKLYSIARTFSFRDFIIINLALTTGLRNSELCDLTVECIRAYEIIPNVMMLPGTIAKGGVGREIPLHPDTRKHLLTFLEYKSSHKEDLSPTAPLFCSKYTHNKLSPRDLQRIVGNISKTSIGRSINPHVLRHTFATRLLYVSNLEIVRKVLGHRNIQTTQIYVHPSSNDISEAVNKM